ncbi:MAG: Chaperone protein DnaJ [Mycoplasmataceae bacterium]|nr:MAG: Chaperone protein DnaJ [Mycoplasmataceae bacterium]
MAKKYYQILEVNENTSSEDIRKSYRKLATQWHPDKWANKTIEERLKATEKMQELNEAYEVLGDEEKRRRYNSGLSERDFVAESNYNNYFEAEMDRANEKFKKACYNETILSITSKIVHDCSGILGSFSKHLDSSIWAPYQDWGEKVLSIKINNEDLNNNGHLKNSSELFKFREKMIAHIKKIADDFRTGIRVEPVALNTRIKRLQK